MKPKTKRRKSHVAHVLSACVGLFFLFTLPTFSQASDDIISHFDATQPLHAPTSDNHYQYVYDAAGNVTEKNHPNQQTTYHYTPFNKLQKVEIDDVPLARYVYGLNGQRVARISADGDIDRYYGSMETQGNDATSYYFYGGRRVAKRTPNGAFRFFTQDHLGSTSVITDESGQPVLERQHYEFGALKTEIGSDHETHDYNDKRLDRSTKLHDFEARSLASTTGRFLQPDSIIPNAADPQSFNRYAYVKNNPLKYIDPTGHADELSATELAAKLKTNPMVDDLDFVPSYEFMLDVADHLDNSEVFFQNNRDGTWSAQTSQLKGEVSVSSWPDYPDIHTHPPSGTVTEDGGKVINLVPSQGDAMALKTKHDAAGGKRVGGTIVTRGPDGKPFIFAFRPNSNGTMTAYYKFSDGGSARITFHPNARGTKAVHDLVKGHILGTRSIQRAANAMPHSITYKAIKGLKRRLPGLLGVLLGGWGLSQASTGMERIQALDPLGVTDLIDMPDEVFGPMLPSDDDAYRYSLPSSYGLGRICFGCENKTWQGGHLIDTAPRPIHY